MNFGHKSSLTILVIFQVIVFFQKTYMYYTHLCLFEWKTSSKCFLWNHMNRTLHIELKWDNELIWNIWLNTWSNLVIFWMVFEVYLHFVVYWYNYNFFINIFFNHLILILKWDFFLQYYSLGFELPYSKLTYYLCSFAFSSLIWYEHLKFFMNFETCDKREFIISN
jgi:hypothetical protein